MPELPEVETTRRGIAPHIEGRIITGVVVRERRLRWPVPTRLQDALAGRTVREVRRRGKYLLLDCGNGSLILHLGMSGSLRVIDARTPPRLHEHVDIIFGTKLLRLRDPRRFGAVLWTPGDAEKHKLISNLGVEPLADAFTGDWLYRATRNRNASIKLTLMNSSIVVGVGNIYASEALFRAGILPGTGASRLTRPRCARLVIAIRDTLNAAITAGGSTLRDFVHIDGGSGWFQQQHFVYGRSGLPCRTCDTPIRTSRMGQRSTFWCPSCQR